MRAILISLMIIAITNTVNAEKVCKKMQYGTILSLPKEEYAVDWSCGIRNPYIGPELEVFNHTEFNIDRIELQAGKMWGRNTNIPARTSQIFKVENASICRQANIKLKLFFTKYFRTKTKCMEYYTASELADQNQLNKQAETKAKKLREKQTQMNILRDNCIISKSKNTGDSVMQEIRRICTEISKNPSMIQKFRWGS